MSKQIDERIVSLQFDNKHFEANVKTTMGSLDKLKEKLSFKNTSKGFNELNTAAKKTDLSPLAKSVEVVQARFSALDIIGTTALANITNSAVNAGKRMLKALTLDPVTTGFKEYETQINAVQTILANTKSKGSTIDDVNAALEELNKYADQTIYNFTEMTRNIGTFTAAGVDLDTSTNAIKGIANLAAVSGSTSQQASTAMYQLSQALASGTVKLMDWNSVVNAGMGGQVFQDALKETARAHGVAIDKMIKKEGSFRETLKDGWLTSEILTDTLQKFTLTTEGLTEEQIEANREMLRAKGYTEEQIKGIFELGNTATDAATKVKTFSQLWDVMKESAQSGWAQTWKLIIGDFEEAKALLTPLANFLTGAIQSFDNIRNTIIEGAMSSPFAKFAEKIASIGAVTQTVSDKLKDYEDVVNRIIKGDYGNGQSRWDKLTEEGYDWAHAQNLVNERLGDSTRHTTNYTEAVAETTKQLAELTDEELRNLDFTEDEIKMYRELEKQAKETGVSISELLENMSQMDGRTMMWEGLGNIGKSIASFFGAIKNAWVEIFPPENIALKLYNLIAGFYELSQKLVMSDESADKLKRTFKGVFAVLDIILTIVGGPIKLAFKLLSQLVGAANLDFLTITAYIGDVIVGFRDFIDATLDFTSVFKKIIPYLLAGAEAVSGWVAAIRESGIVQNIISGFVNGLQNGISTVCSVVAKLGSKILEVIKNILGIHSPSTEFFDIGKNVILGFVNGLKNGLSGVLNFFKGLGKSCIELIRKIDFGAIFTVAVTAGLAIAAKKTFDILDRFADVAEAFAAPFLGLADALSGVGRWLDSIAAKNKAKVWEIRSKAILNMAISIGILAASLYVLAKIPWQDLLKGTLALVALGGVVVALSYAASKINTSGGEFGKFSLMLVGISASLLLMATAIKKLGFLNEDNVGYVLGGLAAMIGGLSLVFIAFGTFVKGKAAQNIDKAGMTILKMSFVMLSLVTVIKMVSKLEPEALIKGSVAISLFGGMITGLIVATRLGGKNIDKIGSMILKISAAMLLMTVVIKMIGGMDAAKLTKGITGVALFGGLVVGLIAATKFVSGKDLTKVGSTIMGISGAILLLAFTSRIISGLDPVVMSKGIAGIVCFGAIVVGLVAATRLVGGNELKRVGTTILAMSLAIGLLAAASMALSLINVGGLLKGVVAVGILSGLISLMIYATKDAEDCKGNIIAMSIAIGVMAVAVAALSFIDASKLAGASAALSLVVGMFALAIKAAGNAQKAIGNIMVMVVAVGLIAGIIALLTTFVDCDEAVKAAMAISAVALAMSATLKVLSTVKMDMNVLGGIGGLIVMCGLLVGFAWALSTIPDVSDKNATIITLTATMAALSVLLLALTGVGAILAIGGGVGALCGLAGIAGLIVMLGTMYLFAVTLQKIPNISDSSSTIIMLTDLMSLMTGLLTQLAIIGPFALLGVASVAALSTVMVALGSLAVGVGALMDKFPALESFIDKGMPILEKLANGIGSIVGNFVSGFATGVMSSLPEMGALLGRFMTNAMPFIDGSKLIDDMVVKGVGVLTKAILTLTAADFISGIVAFISGGSSFTQLGSDLSLFMTNAMPFILGAKLIDSAVIDGVKSLSEIVLTLTGAGVIEGLTSWLTGGTSFVDFGKQLCEFGPYLNDFAAAVSEIDSNTITIAANAGKTLAEMASTIPSDWGHNNLSKFGEQFESYGEDIVSFSDTVNGGVDLDSITAASKAGKVLAGMADAIPTDWNHNNLSKFGEQIVSFAKSLVSFNVTVNGQTAGITQAKTAIEGLISYLSNAASTESAKIDKFTKTFAEVGQNGIKGLVESLSIPNEAVSGALNAFFDSIVSTASGWAGVGSTIYNQFQSVGSYAIDGFVAGLSSANGLARVTAAGTKLGDYAYEAAKKAIDSNSPSKKFAELGLFSILGYAKGVKDNLKTVDKSGRSIGTGVLAAFQDELEIHSPSVVMSKQGHYVVQGVADGIKKDMSAEEAAEKKAQNIVGAFQKEFDKTDIASSIAQNEFDLWKLTDGKNTSKYETNRKEQEFYKGEGERLAKNTALAYDKWREMINHGFKEGSKEEREAFNDYKEALLNQEKNNQTLRDLKLREWDDMAERAQNEIDLADSEYQTWLATEGRYASKAEQYEKLEKYLNDERIWLSDIRARALWKLEWLKENGGTQEEIAAAQKAYNDAVQNVAANEDKQSNLDRQREYDDKYELYDRRDAEIDRDLRRWKAKHGGSATEQEILIQEIAASERRTSNLTSEYVTAQQEYVSILAKHLNDPTHEEVIAAKEKADEAEIAALESAAENSEKKKKLVEIQRDNERDVLELASEIAEHQYNIWEKTAGRKAKDTEKDNKRLELYASQMEKQRTIYEMALEDMRTAADTYGKDSQEYRDAYRSFLQEQSDLVNLQDEILTTQENLQKRQKKQYNKQQLAMSEYKDYIKKYKQYYLEHGLTMEELEADAKAAANYDPSKTVENVVNKTSSALNAALSTSGAVSLGASYVQSVSTGMSESIPTVRETTQSMLNSCSTILTEAQAEWLELGKQCVTAFGNGILNNKLLVIGYAKLVAHYCRQHMQNAAEWRNTGKQCVVGFANGIRVNSWIAAEAAAYVAREAIEAARSTFDINSPSKVFWDTAKYCVEGLAGGFTDNSNLSDVAARSLAEDAIDSFTLAIAQITDAVDSEMDIQPTIRPVLDLSNVERGAVRLSNMFSRDQALGISAMRNPDSNPQNQNGVDSSSSGGKTINYVQNNYSPKALSPTDIYRRTKNQLSAMKGVL